VLRRIFIGCSLAVNGLTTVSSDIGVTFIFSLSFAQMASKEQVCRARVVQFFEKHRLKGKPYAVQPFIDEGISRRTVYNILRHYEERGEYARKPGYGRPATIMTKKRVKRLVKKLMSAKPPSTRALARSFISGLAVNKEVHMKNCLQERLLPFIRNNHPLNSCVLA
jgi:hypothetical protein